MNTSFRIIFAISAQDKGSKKNGRVGAADALGHLQPSGFKVTREGTPVLAGWGGGGGEIRGWPGHCLHRGSFRNQGSLLIYHLDPQLKLQ